MSQYDYNDYLPKSVLTLTIYAEMHDLLNDIISDHKIQQKDIKKTCLFKNRWLRQRSWQYSSLTW